MERFTISLEDNLARQFEAFIQQQGYSNRSEAIRDLIRSRLESDRLRDAENGDCVAALSYVYNHHESELATRITSAHHHHHDLTLANMHVHLDHDNCLEIAILKGPIKHVEDFANAVIAVRGVRHGNLHMVPIEVDETAHSPDGHKHVHIRPRT